MTIAPRSTPSSSTGRVFGILVIHVMDNNILCVGEWNEQTRAFMTHFGPFFELCDLTRTFAEPSRVMPC